MPGSSAPRSEHPGYAGKPRQVVIVQDDLFDATASVTICAFTIDETDAQGLGYLLAQQLLAVGEEVLDVPPVRASRVRKLSSGLPGSRCRPSLQHCDGGHDKGSWRT